MAVNEIITAARYNEMQSKLALVLGNGTGDFGYGQPLTSSQVTKNTSTVEAVHMQRLKTDVDKVYFHQNNVATGISNVSVSDDITDAVYVEYINIIDNVYNNRFKYNITQMTAPESGITSLRRTDWGGSEPSGAGSVDMPQTLVHEVEITFNSNDHFRHFFNSGGEIRMRGTLSGGSGAKYNDWKAMLASLNTLTLNYLNSTGGSGTSFAVGAFDLTSTYQTLWTKAGSGVYDNNLITYSGKVVDNKLYVKIEYHDGDPKPGITPGTTGIDERVNGELNSIVEQQRATGQNVEVPTPTYRNLRTIG